jgi:hypothetical protein
MLSVSEIESALEKLPPEQQRTVAEWLNARLYPETPALIEALDRGIQSLASEPTTSVEALRRKLAGWTSR